MKSKTLTQSKETRVLVFATERNSCFQFNSSVYSDDCSDGPDLEREGQAHQNY